MRVDTALPGELKIWSILDGAGKDLHTLRPVPCPRGRSTCLGCVEPRGWTTERLVGCAPRKCRERGSRPEQHQCANQSEVHCDTLAPSVRSRRGVGTVVALRVPTRRSPVRRIRDFWQPTWPSSPRRARSEPRESASSAFLVESSERVDQSLAENHGRVTHDVIFDRLGRNRSRRQLAPVPQGTMTPDASVEWHRDNHQRARVQPASPRATSSRRPGSLRGSLRHRRAWTSGQPAARRARRRRRHHPRRTIPPGRTHDSLYRPRHSPGATHDS